MSRAVPPPLHTGEAGSFARDTLARRVPEILAETRRDLGTVPVAVDQALAELDRELRDGSLRGLREQAPDRADWDAAVAPHVGRSWLDLPWYFAEAFFYRRVLEATGYFSTAPGDGGAVTLAGVDPYAAKKAIEWQPDQAPRRCADALAAAPPGGSERLAALLAASLWGNRVDLSYNVAAALGSDAGTDVDVVVDDRATLIGWLADRRPARVVIIADNAGTELCMDLALADHLLGEMAIERVELHVKDHPFFVSDAVAHDVDDALAVLAFAGAPAVEAVATRLRAARLAGRFLVQSHPFYTKSLFYLALPGDLRASLAGADLVIVKGDANYRRLCSDARWPAETPFADVVAYFPTPLVALRTLKAEVIVGLPAGRAETLTREDPHWRTNGRRGVIQARLPISR